tara:strand:- start:11875 stop:12120 length:246 start_codon:yes stop_codon:yes gene_type:complete
MSYHVQQRQQRQPRFTVQEVGFFTDVKKKAKEKLNAAASAAKKAAEKFLAKKTTNPNPKTKTKTKPKIFMSEKLFVPPSGC